MSTPSGPPARRSLRFSTAEYEQLRQLVRSHAGLALAPEKQREVEQKLGACCRAGDSAAALLDQLHRSPDQLQDVVEELTVGESYFNRNRPHFEALRIRVIPELVRDAGARRKLTFWSAACATGEEPYSLALLLDQHFPSVADWNITIRGSDLNRRFLAWARQARYPAWSLRSIEPALVSRYFQRTGRDAYQLRPALQRRVILAEHNLISDREPPGKPPEGFDLVLCRSVLIYFDRELSNEVINRLIEALRPGGFLFVGHVDSYPTLGALKAIYECGTFFYQKPLAATPRRITRTRLIPGLAVKAWSTGASDTTAPSQATAATRPPTGPGAPRPDAAPHETAAGPTQVALDQVRELADKGQVAAALAGLGQLAVGAGRLDHRVHFLRALVADQAGLRAEPRQSLRQALFLKRDFVVAHYFLGVLADRDQDWSTALRCFHNAGALLATRPAAEVLEETGGLTAGRLREIVDQRIQCIHAEQMT